LTDQPSALTMHHGLEDCSACRGGVLAIGNFDGVHRGHQKMLAVLTERAKSLGVPAVAMTFDPPPVQLLRPEHAPPRLSTLAAKSHFMERCGVDGLIVYPTDRALLELEPEEFFEQIVLDQLDAKGLVEGPNFFFGKDRRGDVKLLNRLCRQVGRFLEVIEPEVEGDQLVSSSAIRHLITQDKFAEATRLLGHAYRLEGQVIAGEGRGKSLGFPTANLSKIETLIPSDGVYAGYAWTPSNRSAGGPHRAAIHIGPNPTFAQQDRKVEIHVLDYAGDLYGQTMSVDLVQKTRGTKTFAGAETLQEQIECDLREIRSLLSHNGNVR